MWLLHASSAKLQCQVYEIALALQQSKTLPYSEQHETEQTRRITNWRHTIDAIQGYLRDLRTSFRHQAFLPSFSGALLYFTVLNFAGQMVTYLLASGYNSFHIGIARTLSVIFEIAASDYNSFHIGITRTLSVIFEIASTWTAPSVMSGIGPIRAGIWFINWQILCLAGAAGIFLGAPDPIVAASGLVVGTILSRVGLRGFDLCAQIIVQEVSP